MREIAREAPFGGTFLIAQFEDFYREVVRMKWRIGKGDWLFLGAEEEPEAGREMAPNAVWQTLLHRLEHQALTARRTGGDFAGAIFAQAQYVMAGLADEVFLNLDWPGREMWRDQLLESRLFNSHLAGDVIFERIDELLASPNPVYVELARIYLAALGLGFQGKYRGRDDAAAELGSYRRRLLTFITMEDPTLIEGRERLSPEAYASTLDQGGAGRDLPHLRPWIIAFLVILALWILGSHLVWRELTGELRPLIDRIVAPAQEEEPPF